MIILLELDIKNPRFVRENGIDDKGMEYLGKALENNKVNSNDFLFSLINIHSMVFRR